MLPCLRSYAKLLFCPTIFCSHKYHTIVNKFIFEHVKKIFVAKTLRIIVLFIQNFVIELSKIWIWNPGSEIRDPGSKRHRIPDPDPQHCLCCAVQDNQLGRLRHRYQALETENRDLRLQLRLSEGRNERRSSTGGSRPMEKLK
jgi:hypothetical protein